MNLDTKKNRLNGGFYLMSKKHWHSEDIKSAVRKRGKTLEALATDNGYSKSACSAALLRQFPEVETIIATFIEVPPQELWPDRYNQDGTSKPVRPTKSTRHDLPGHGQKQAAR